MPEIPQTGWDGLAKMMLMTVRNAMRRKEELQDHGVICYMNLGKPRHKRVVWFESKVIEFFSHKGAKREKI